MLEKNINMDVNIHRLLTTLCHHNLYVSWFFFFAASSFPGSIFALTANRWKEEILSEHLLIIKFSLWFLNESRNPRHLKKCITIHKVIWILVDVLFCLFFTFQATEWWYTCQVCLRRLRKICRKAKVSLPWAILAYCLPYKLFVTISTLKNDEFCLSALFGPFLMCMLD